MTHEIQPMSADAEGVQRLQELFARNGDEKDLQALRWRYLLNPTAETFVDFAIDRGSDRTAGVYCVCPNRFKVGDETRLAVQSIDTLTDSEFRGQGVFKKLARATYARCGEHGAAFVYGFPNERSAFGFFERLGWSRLDPVPFLVRPLSVPYALGKLGLKSATLDRAFGRPLLRSMADVVPPRGQEIRVVTDFDSAFDAIWDDFASTVEVGLVRDAAYLRWRFTSNPIGRYKTLGLFEGGELRAYVVFRVAEKHGGRVGYVMELLHRRGASSAARLILRQATVEMARASADVVLAWCLEHSANRPAYAEEGFCPLPERVRPIELHFGARHLASTDVAVCNRRSWYLSYCDSDTV